MNLAQTGAAGYLNSMREDDYVHIKFLTTTYKEYCVNSYIVIFFSYRIVIVKFQYHLVVLL